MTIINSIPLLRPEMPEPEEILPFLIRMKEFGQYSNFGPLVLELEREFSKNFNIDFSKVTTVSNATVGIELALVALALPKGSKVLIPALTFVATATAVYRAGLEPVICDVDEKTWLLTPEIAKEVLQVENISAVIPVSSFGVAQCSKSWGAFKAETGVPVIVDAAAGYGNQLLEDDAEITLVISLHTTKSLPAGEGGIVISNVAGLARRVRELSNFGISSQNSLEHSIGASFVFGTNAKMSEFHAAVGLASLATWGAKANKRRELFLRLKDKIDIVSNREFIWQHSSEKLKAPTLLCGCVKDGETRDIFEKYCAFKNISTRRWYQPLINKMPAFTSVMVSGDLHNALHIENTLVGLPFFASMTISEENYLVDEIFNFFESRKN